MASGGIWELAERYMEALEAFGRHLEGLGVIKHDVSDTQALGYNVKHDISDRQALGYNVKNGVSDARP